MRFLITFDTSRGQLPGRESWIVEDATLADADRWRRAAQETPDEVLTFERVRIHETAGTAGRGWLRAGRILSVRSA